MRSLLAFPVAVSVSVVLGAGLLAPASAAPPLGDLPTLDAPAAFSPDGNGVRDTARVRLGLPRADRATLQIRDSRGTKVRVVRLGRISAGTHTWRWDGRDARGRRLPDGSYRIRLRLATPDPRRVEEVVRLDTSFEAAVTPAQRYADPTSRPVRVFPRTSVVRDAVHLDVSGVLGDPVLRRARLLIKDSDGAVVLRRTKAKVRSDWRIRWTARRGGSALPPGEYRAVVHGRDRLGNAGRSAPLVLRVSGKRLVWHEETRTLPASEHRMGPCAFTTADGCWDLPDHGTVVPSERYDGGLSFRSAAEVFYLPVPRTTGVRGVHSARVTFTGSPTVAGGSDAGRLSLTTTTSSPEVSGTSTATTPWATDLFLGDGSDAGEVLPRRDPGVVWSFSARGTDSFDVATFTVDLRSLVPRR